jgi:hypothetical protein
MTEKIDLTQISQSSATLDQAIVWSGTDWVSRTVKAGSAGILAAARTFSLTGDMNWTTTFDGSANVTGVGTLATVNSNVGSFGSTSAVPILTVNAKGLVTAVSTAALGNAAIRNTGTSGNTIPFLDGANTWAAAQAFSAKITAATPTASIASITLPHGVAPTTPVNGDLWTTTAGLFARINSVTKTVAYLDSSITGSAASAAILTTARSITTTGDVSWTTSFNGSANVTGAATLATVNANVGSFGSTTAVPIITVNAKGLITALSTATLGTAAVQNIGNSGATVPLLSTANTWSTDQTFSGNVSVAGNLTVAGSTFAINSTNLEVSDAIITLAKDNSAGTAGFIGIKAERGTVGPDAYMVWDETTDQFEVQTATSDAQAGTIAVPFQASQFRSVAAAGTSPFTVASSTLVANLNADLLDGQDGTYYLNASNFSAGTLPAARLPAQTGDVTSPANSAVFTLATVNSNVGSFGSTSTVPVLTVNAKGLVTSVSTAALGSAAVRNIGTSGTAIPLLDAGNSWSALQFFSEIATQKAGTGGGYGYVGLNAQASDPYHSILLHGYPTAASMNANTDITAANAMSFVEFGGDFRFYQNDGTTLVKLLGITSSAVTTSAALMVGTNITAAGTISGSNFSGSSSGTNTGDQTTISGNAGSATKLATARTIATTGDITQTLSFDGTANVSAPATLATVNANVGTYGASGTLNVPILTVNAKGLVTAASQYALGSAASKNTGTSGNTIPLLDGANTYSGSMTVTGNATFSATTRASGLYLGPSGSAQLVGTSASDMYLDGATHNFRSESGVTRGTWNASGLTVTNRLLAQNVQSYYLTRTLPVVVNDCVAIGGFTGSNGAYNLRISITVSASAFSIAQTYVVTGFYGATGGAWQVVQEESGTGPFSGQDVQLELAHSTSGLSLRIRRLSGTTVGDATIHITNLGLINTAFTEDATVSTPPVVTAVYNSAAPLMTNLVVGADNFGITFYEGARVYKRQGAGLTLRRHVGETDPMVENSAGTAQWKIWHAGNHGAGSGLDADLLDGQSGTYYAPIAGPIFSGGATAPTFKSTGADAFRMRSPAGEYTVIHRNDGANYYLLFTNLNDADGSWNAIRPMTINLATGGVTSGSTWTITNPVTASQFNGPVNGNASSATVLQTARSIAMTGDVTWSTSFNGSGNVTGTATLASVNANVGTFGASGAVPILTINAKGLITGATTANVPMVANFPAGSAYSTIYSSDIRNAANPLTGIGFARGVRFRFSSLNDDSAAPWADVIDLSTYADSSGGAINALYVAKNSFQIQHKQQAGGTTGTTWSVKTLAYLDSDITGSAAKLGGQLPSYYTDIPGRLGYTPATLAASNSFTGEQIFTTVRINGYGGNQWMQGTGDNATYATHNTQLQIWWGLGIKAHDGVVRGVIDARAGTIDMLGGFRHNGATVWSSSNDGAGSGLDADILDGQQGSYYADIPGRLGYAPVSRNGADTMKASLTISSADQSQSRLIINNTSGSTYSLVAGTHNETQANFSLYDNTASLTRLVVDNSGNFFFRTGQLNVQKSTTGVGLTMSNTNNSGNSGYAYVQFGTDGTTVTNNFHIGSGGDGNFGIWSGIWGSGVLKASFGVTSSYFNTAIGIGTNGAPQSMLHLQASPNVDGALKYQMIVRNTDAITTLPIAGIIFQNLYTTGGAPAGMGGIAVGKQNTTTNDFSSWLGLYTRLNGGSTTERLRISPEGKVGIGTTSPSAFLDVSFTQTTFGTTESYLRLSNPSTGGQTPLDFFFAGNLRGRVRGDYVGNLNYSAFGGGHAFYVNGDSGTGSVALSIDTSARLILGSSASNHGYIRLTGAGIGEGNIYHDATYGVKIDTAGNSLPIAIAGSRLDILGATTVSNTLHVQSNFLTVSNGSWGGVRGGTGPTDAYHGIVFRGDVVDTAGSVTAGDLMCLYDYSGIFNFRQWNSSTNSIIATLRPAGSSINTSLTVGGDLYVNSSASFDAITLRRNGQGTNILIGDDAYIGDINLANGFMVRGMATALSGYIQFGTAGSQLGVENGNEMRINVAGGAKTIGLRAYADYNDASIWTGRIMSSNSTHDKAIFIGHWNAGSASAISGRAVVAAHNNALSAWAPLYLNTTTQSDGGIVYANGLNVMTLTVAGSGVVRETSTVRPGVTKLYRREDNSAFNVQTYWNGSRWVMYGYNGDTEHAGVLVDYANSSGYAASAGNASTAGNATTVGNIDINGLSRGTVGNVGDTNLDGGASKYLRWRNYGNGHIIFDASSGTSPSGSAIDRTTAQVGWNASDPRFPTLMGWNGSTTYGLRVDSARISDTAANATLATTALYLDGLGKVDYMKWNGAVNLADIDGATSNGYYRVQNSNDQSSLLVFNTEGSNGTTQYRHTYSGTMEFRNKTDNTYWNGWKRVWTTQDFDVSSEILGNTVARRDGNGDIKVRYFFQNSANGENNPISQVMTTNGDGYFRKAEVGYFCGQIAGIIKNVSNQISGINQYVSNFDTGTGNNAPLQAISNNNGGAVMSFHRQNNFAINMGLDSDTVFRIGGWSAGANRLQMDMSGNLTMSGDITAFSDIRKKKNIATIENGLDKVLAMRGVTFERIEDDKKSSGVIAQELEEIAPELVLTDNDGMKSVAYGNMVGYLIESIKTLEARIRELEGKQ